MKMLLWIDYECTKLRESSNKNWINTRWISLFTELWTNSISFYRQTNARKSPKQSELLERKRKGKNFTKILNHRSADSSSAELFASRSSRFGSADTIQPWFCYSGRRRRRRPPGHSSGTGAWVCRQPSSPVVGAPKRSHRCAPSTPAKLMDSSWLLMGNATVAWLMMMMMMAVLVASVWPLLGWTRPLHPMPKFATMIYWLAWVIHNNTVDQCQFWTKFAVAVCRTLMCRRADGAACPAALDSWNQRFPVDNWLSSGDLCVCDPHGYGTKHTC